MKKKQWARLAAVLLTVGTMGVVTVPVEAADPIVIDSLSKYDELKNDGTLSKDRVSMPTASKDNNTVTVTLGNENLTGNSLTAGSGTGNQLIINSGIFGKEGGNDSDSTSFVYGSFGTVIAHKNTVIINGGTFYQDVYGGEARGNGSKDQERVKENNVEIHGGEVQGIIVGGWLTSGDGKVTYNAVSIDGNASVQTVYGGHSHKFTQDGVENNTVGVSGSATAHELYGGYGLDNVNHNEVAITGDAKVLSQAYGGYSIGGSVSGNTASVSESANIEGSLYGGYTEAGNGLVSDNTVKASGNATAYKLYGGYSLGDGAVKNNTAVASGEAHITDTIYGGYSDSNGEVSNNTVSVYDKANVDTELRGGHSERGSVFENIVNASGSTTVTNLYGGSSRNGSVSKNTVNASVNATVNGDVYGGYSDSGSVSENTVNVHESATVHGRLYGGYSDSGLVSTNIVNISGSATVTNIYGGSSFGSGSAVENTVNVHDSATVNGDIYCGYSTDGSVSKNTVTVQGQANINGTWILGAYSVYNTANSNKVEISGGTVTSDIAGGYGTSANDNSVVFSGGTISADVYGGYASADISNDNTITLKNNVDVSQTSLYGSAKSAEDTTGNTLVIDNWTSSGEKGNAVARAENFNAITFKNLSWQKDGVALDITNAESTKALSNTQVNVEKLSLPGGTTLQAGDTMTFIRSNEDTGLSMANVSVAEDSTFTQGVAAVGEFDTRLDGPTNNLIGEIKGIARNPQTDLIAENRAVAAAFVNQGADIAAESLDLMSDDYKYGVRTFGAVYGSRSKYDVNSDLKINGWNTIVGVGNVHRKGDANLAWGVFYENGTGNYRTENSFNDEFFRGDGSLVYNGGGAAVRYKKDSGAYYEASFRIGTLNSSMSNAVRDGEGNSYGYDSDSTYWGTHLGIGKLIQSGSGQWNVYGKYFHTEVEGDNFAIAGDEFTFDDVTSDRLRLGARYTADTDKDWSLYYGLAWEYEFNGDSNMKAGQFDAPEQSLQGSTGIAEIGTVWRSDDSPWRADINLKGYTGEREGFSGMVHLTYMF